MASSKSREVVSWRWTRWTRERSSRWVRKATPVGAADPEERRLDDSFRRYIAASAAATRELVTAPSWGKLDTPRENAGTDIHRTWAQAQAAGAAEPPPNSHSSGLSSCFASQMLSQGEAPLGCPHRHFATCGCRKFHPLRLSSPMSCGVRTTKPDSERSDRRLPWSIRRRSLLIGFAKTSNDDG